MKILYFHGWASSKKSKTYLDLVDRMKDDQIDCYDLNYNSINFMNTLETTVFSLAKNYDMIIGSSHGGYVANIVANRLGIPLILINPSTKPSKNLQKYKIDTSLVSMYQRLDVKYPHVAHLAVPTIMILGKNDEVLDPSIAYGHFSSSQVIWTDDGHRLDSIDPLIHSIDILRYSHLTSL